MADLFLYRRQQDRVWNDFLLAHHEVQLLPPKSREMSITEAQFYRLHINGKERPASYP